MATLAELQAEAKRRAAGLTPLQRLQQEVQRRQAADPRNAVNAAIEAAKAGTLKLSPERAAQQAEIDAKGAAMMQRPSGAMGVAQQFGVGSQSGIAAALGFPVDAVTGGINGVGQLTGAWAPIQNPIGGSATFQQLLAPFRAGVGDPNGRGERMARRMGEEVGASAVMAPLAALSPAVRARPMAAAGVETVSALGSGTGAAIANEIAPDSVTADIVGALLGGLPTGMAGARAFNMGGTDAVVRPGIEDQRLRAKTSYDAVRADPRVLPQDSVDDLALGISSKMDAERINPRLQPGSSAILDAILQDSSGPMRIEDVENLRRVTQQSLPATASQADVRLATIMKDEITDYLDNLGDPVADTLREGRDAHRRATAAQTISDAETKAARRASSTGSGGNEINAMRQTIRGVLDSPRKARSFTPDELAQMAGIVSGTGGQNALRRLSRFAPSSGGLSSMLGIGGTLASPGVALPIMAVTEIAKAAGEQSTRKSIANLLQSLAPDRMLATSQQGVTPIIAALLAARTAANAQ